MISMLFSLAHEGTHIAIKIISQLEANSNKSVGLFIYLLAIPSSQSSHESYLKSFRQQLNELRTHHLFLPLKCPTMSYIVFVGTKNLAYESFGHSLKSLAG